MFAVAAENPNVNQDVCSTVHFTRLDYVKKNLGIFIHCFQQQHLEDKTRQLRSFKNCEEDLKIVFDDFVMLLKPTVPRLKKMLQTIYETESCFSSDGVSGREQPLELLPQNRIHNMPTSGKLNDSS